MSTFKSKTRSLLQWVLAMGLSLSPVSAFAQKAADQVRIGFFDPVSSILLYDDSQPEIGFTSRAVFDPLICFDKKTGQFAPLLATSWKIVDEKTLEFDLRQDVKFHDGSPFSADDLVYTLRWLTAPDTNFRFKENFDWFAGIEKLSDYKVRMALKRPIGIAMIRLAISFAVLPAKLHQPLADKAEFGRKTPIGTGPYKAEYVDANRGVSLIRNADYKQGNECKPAARVNRIKALPIPDIQTQVAQMNTGGLDLLHVASKDIVDFMASNPNYAITASQAITFHYMAMDSINRSGNQALSNPKVRQALMQAIDRGLVTKTVVPGGDEVKPIDALCFKVQLGCAYSTKPPEFDREAARKLLIEAGYPNGFDVEITATPGSYDLGDALAGELRKINVRAKVDKVTFVAYRQKQKDSKLQILVGQWTSGGVPDASSSVEFYFDRGARDYWRDPQIDKWSEEASIINDEAKRKEIYGKIFDRANEARYILPISTKPDVFIHIKDLNVARGSLSVYGADANELSWK